MTMPTPDPDALAALLEALQQGVRTLWHTLGLAAPVHGQPAWPFAQQLALHLLSIDGGHARQVALVLALTAAGLVLMLVAALAAVVLVAARVTVAARAAGRPPRRAGLAGLAGRAATAAAGAGLLCALAVAAAWPDPRLLWMPAWPTSLHRAAPAAASLAPQRAQALYRQHCAACHGAQGDGDGPWAGRRWAGTPPGAAPGPLATLPSIDPSIAPSTVPSDSAAVTAAARGLRTVAGTGNRPGQPDGADSADPPPWPPTLNRNLLWVRREGELFWHIRHGMRAADGRPTMPALPPEVDDAAAWQLLQWLGWQAAGQQLVRSGRWLLPVAAPAIAVACEGRPVRPLTQLRGQRLRLVAVAPGQPLPAEDPRLQTVVITPVWRADANCQSLSPSGWSALALLSGVAEPQLAGTEFLLDRDGWLRARRRPDEPPWSDAQLLCSSTPAPMPAATRPPEAAADGLDRLLARLDAEPVRPVRGGRVH